MMGLAKAKSSSRTNLETDELLAAAHQMYISDADSGIRSVAEYLLNTMHTPLPLAFGQSQAQADRNWSLNSQGEMLVHMDATESVPYRFAIASHELTCQQFETFVKKSGYAWSGTAVSGEQENADELLARPQVDLSWYDCAALCNWLSRQEGLDEVYAPNAEGKFAHGMQIKPDFHKLSGYRLPTSAEWLLACRAGTTTKYYFGDNEIFSFKYAWSHPKSEGHPHPVGHMRPNSLGLFDTLGNASEWMMEVDRYPAGLTNAGRSRASHSSRWRLRYQRG